MSCHNLFVLKNLLKGVSLNCRVKGSSSSYCNGREIAVW